MLALGLIIKNIVGWIVLHLRVVLIAVGLLAVIIASALIFRSCKPKPKLNEVEIQKAEEAKKAGNDVELRKILVAAEVKSQQVDMDVANVKVQTINAEVDAKKKYENMNNQELADALEKMK